MLVKAMNLFMTVNHDHDQFFVQKIQTCGKDQTYRKHTTNCEINSSLVYYG